MCWTPSSCSVLHLFCIPPFIVRPFEDVRWHICRDWATGDIWGVEEYLHPMIERAVSPATIPNWTMSPQFLGGLTMSMRSSKFLLNLEISICCAKIVPLVLKQDRSHNTHQALPL